MALLELKRFSRSSPFFLEGVTPPQAVSILGCRLKSANEEMYIL
jgi:hypothetical protein